MDAKKNGKVVLSVGCLGGSAEA
eukprot:COSAG02_NODE_70577_length_195_cov_20.822917_1_plen_22_part_10